VILANIKFKFSFFLPPMVPEQLKATTDVICGAAIDQIDMADLKFFPNFTPDAIIVALFWQHC
jgi:hypothetical protein